MSHAEKGSSLIVNKYLLRNITILRVNNFSFHLTGLLVGTECEFSTPAHKLYKPITQWNIEESVSYEFLSTIIGMQTHCFRIWPNNHLSIRALPHLNLSPQAINGCPINQPTVKVKLLVTKDHPLADSKLRGAGLLGCTCSLTIRALPPSSSVDGLVGGKERYSALLCSPVLHLCFSI